MQFQSELPHFVQLASLKKLVEREPDNIMALIKLARHHAFADQHTEALALADIGQQLFPHIPAFSVVKGECLNALGDPEQARDILSAIPDSAPKRLQSNGWYEHGLAQEALHQPLAAEQSYMRSLALDPASPRPCKALHQLQRTRGDLDAMVRSCNALEAAGIRHARLHADRIVATALIGRKAEALELCGRDRFAYFLTIENELDRCRWPDSASFNAAVLAELEVDPNRHYGRRGTASRGAWRLQQPFSGFGKPALLELRDIIARVVERHAISIKPDKHFFSQRANGELICRNWAICAPGDGYEDWHVHPGAWMTGVYYVRVPALPETDKDIGGCITFGLPDYDDMPAAGEDWLTLRPHDGMIAIFPSHCFHRTWPTGSSDSRWIIAFDFLPTNV